VIVLGLHAFGHDAAAVLLVDGRAVFAASEERFDRVRHSAAFPARAIAAAFAASGVRPGDVDAVAFPWARGMARWRKAWHVVRRWPRSRAFFREPPDDMLPDRPGYLRAMRGLERAVRAQGIAARVVRVPHHLAHAASATLGLAEGTGAVLTADGMGEWTTAAAWRADHGRLRRLREARYPHSAGKTYSAVTRWLGFRPESDEGKTMGLAAYGDPASPKARFARSLLAPDAKTILRTDVRRLGYPWGEARLYGDAFLETLGPPRAKDEPIRPGDADVARGVQDAVEEVVLAGAKQLLAETDARSLGLAGGLFLNCALNGRLLRELDADVRPFPVAGDAGAAWGAAAWVHRWETGALAAPLETLRLGTDVAATPAAVPALAEEVASHVAAGRLVGVARGRAELGPRALGGRSLLASPTTAASRDLLNARKGREAWRPLAPVVREGETRWFEGLGASPWMILTFRATDAGRRDLAGAVHADGTARVQTVTPHGEPFLSAALDALERRGHPPALLNTSFNRPGEPIVDDAGQALAASLAMRLDAVVLGDRLVARP
jgi:carbamoyltransferase